MRLQITYIKYAITNQPTNQPESGETQSVKTGVK